MDRNSTRSLPGAHVSSPQLVLDILRSKSPSSDHTQSVLAAPETKQSPPISNEHSKTTHKIVEPFLRSQLNRQTEENSIKVRVLYQAIPFVLLSRVII